MVTICQIGSLKQRFLQGLEAGIRDAALVQVDHFEIVAEGVLGHDQVGDCFCTSVAQSWVLFEREVDEALTLADAVVVVLSPQLEAALEAGIIILLSIICHDRAIFRSGAWASLVANIVLLVANQSLNKIDHECGPEAVVIKLDRFDVQRLTQGFNEMVGHDFCHTKSLEPDRPQVGVRLDEITQQLEGEMIISDACLAEIQVLDSVVVYEGSQDLLDCLVSNIWVAADIERSQAAHGVDCCVNELR